jgi:S-formylglutathione hydrolase FrmB
MTPIEIIGRHRSTLHGVLRRFHLRSAALNLVKSYYVYEAPGVMSSGLVPLLYLFRGHEREWVNLKEDGSRSMYTSIEQVDLHIARGLLPPLIAVIPGLNSEFNVTPSLGINMVGTWNHATTGLGPGRFWDYMTEELIPEIETKYPQTVGGTRLMSGFSLGGYTVTLLAFKKAGYFHHAGMYDGLFMWPRLRDPGMQDMPFSDRVWCTHAIFNGAFGKPRRTDAMMRWNATDMMLRASGQELDLMRRTTYWVRSAAYRGRKGNQERAEYFLNLLEDQNLPLGYDSVVLHPEAEHNWHWADTFLIDFLYATLGRTD